MIELDFNSIKVQLELPAVMKKTFVMIIFQFHKGTIRTDVRMLRFTSVEYFNSIKVQLERVLPKSLIDDNS